MQGVSCAGQERPFQVDRAAGAKTLSLVNELSELENLTERRLEWLELEKEGAS